MPRGASRSEGARTRRPIVLSAAAAALAAGALLTASCGGDDNTASPTTAPVPSAPSVPAGKVTFTVENSGKVLHEMVVVPAPDGSAALKQPDGTASEDGTLGEAPDVEVGQTKTFTVTMKPGKYSLLCNLPGHFANGMYADFTVN